MHEALIQAARGLFGYLFFVGVCFIALAIKEYKMHKKGPGCACLRCEATRDYIAQSITQTDMDQLAADTAFYYAEKDFQ